MNRCYTRGVLADVARKLDEWVMARNATAWADGRPAIRACTIRVLGQAALFESRLPLGLLGTRDVDVKADYEDAVRVQFGTLLTEKGFELDPLGREVWMPRETRYETAYAGRFVRLEVAEPEAVLVSKGLKAPTKNRALLTEYLASEPSERFLALAQKYGLELEQFV
jgi:hypothetical protein